MSILKIENLTKYYDKSIGVQNLNLTVNKGEIFGFIGPNGAGKSTTIRAIMGLLIPSSGKCFVDGKDCQLQGVAARVNIGYMPSELSLYENMTAEQFLKFTCDIKKCGYDRIVPLCEKFDLILNKKIKKLSLGNKKKVMFLSAIVTSPKLIILDEPTTGFDPLVQQAFFEQIEQENKNGATIFFSSHILSEVQRICNRVAIIKNGQLMAIEEISAFKDKYLKTINLEADRKLPKLKLSGATNIEQHDNKISFQYKGDMDELVGYLSKINIKSINISDADLESVFLHFYQK